jgi:hypothetical protein
MMLIKYEIFFVFILEDIKQQKIFRESNSYIHHVRIHIFLAYIKCINNKIIIFIIIMKNNVIL